MKKHIIMKNTEKKKVFKNLENVNYYNVVLYL